MSQITVNYDNYGVWSFTHDTSLWQVYGVYDEDNSVGNWTLTIYDTTSLVSTGDPPPALNYAILWRGTKSGSRNTLDGDTPEGVYTRTEGPDPEATRVVSAPCVSFNPHGQACVDAFVAVVSGTGTSFDGVWSLRRLGIQPHWTSNEDEGGVRPEDISSDDFANMSLYTDGTQWIIEIALSGTCHAMWVAPATDVPCPPLTGWTYFSEMSSVNQCSPLSVVSLSSVSFNPFLDGFTQHTLNTAGVLLWGDCHFSFPGLYMDDNITDKDIMFFAARKKTGEVCSMRYTGRPFSYLPAGRLLKRLVFTSNGSEIVYDVESEVPKRNGVALGMGVADILEFEGLLHVSVTPTTTGVQTYFVVVLTPTQWGWITDVSHIGGVMYYLFKEAYIRNITSAYQNTGAPVDGYSNFLVNVGMIRSDFETDNPDDVMEPFDAATMKGVGTAYNQLAVGDFEVADTTFDPTTPAIPTVADFALDWVNADDVILVTLSWTEDATYSDYVIHKSTDGGSSWAILDHVSAVGTLDDDEATTGTTLYRIAIKTTVGRGPWSSEISAVIFDPPAFVSHRGYVTPVHVTSPEQGTAIIFTFTDGTSTFDHYALIRNGSTINPNFTDTTINDSNVDDTEYTYKIRAVQATTGSYAETSATFNTCIAGVVTDLTAPVSNPTDIHLSWTAVGSPYRYEIWVDDVYNSESPTQSAIVTGLSTATTYSFKVRPVTLNADPTSNTDQCRVGDFCAPISAATI